MAFVPNYKHDIFISYAHVDDQVESSTDEGWVTTLVKGLKTRLAQKLGRSDAYKLWFDHDLSRHVRITPQIMDALEKTAILIVILSPGYIASDWCQREKEAFLSFIKESSSRVFIVERDKIKDEDRPSEFEELKGYCFWVQEEGKPPQTLGMPKPNPDDPRYYPYYDAVNDLSCYLAEELQKLKSDVESPHTKTKLSEASPTVFLAEVTDDLDSQRDSMKRYLKQAGIRVLPETCYPFDPRAFKQAVKRDLAKCKLFVQLLSGTAGKKPPDLPQGYVNLQFECAKKAGKTIMQWHSQDLDIASITNADHRAFLQLDTVVATGIEEFKSMVKENVFYTPPSPAKKPIDAFVFVDMESIDRSLSNDVCDMLDRYGAGYILPKDCGSPKEIRNDFEKNLLYCDALIVIYGKSTVDWVKEHLRQSHKILAMRVQPLKALALYEGPPEPKDKPGKLPNMRTINCKKGLNEPELKSFLDSLLKGDIK